MSFSSFMIKLWAKARFRKQQQGLLKDLPPPPSGRRGWPWTTESEPLPDKMPNGNAWPRISIVTPSLNQVAFLEDCIKSIFRQNYNNKEYLMLDGGSSDGSTKILEMMKSDFFYYRSHSDAGQAAAINEGLSNASGDILCWVNSDDGLLPNALSVVATYLRTDQPAWLVGDAISRSISGRSIKRRHVNIVNTRTFIRYKEYWIPQPSVFWNRPMQERIGLLDSSLHYVMDLDWFFRMYMVSKPILIPKPLSFYTVQNQAKTFVAPERVDREYREWIKQRIHEKSLDINELLDDLIFLQRSHKTISEHIVLSRITSFWKRFINPRMYL